MATTSNPQTGTASTTSWTAIPDGSRLINSAAGILTNSFTNPGNLLCVIVPPLGTPPSGSPSVSQAGVIVLQPGTTIDGTDLAYQNAIYLGATVANVVWQFWEDTSGCPNPGLQTFGGYQVPEPYTQLIDYQLGSNPVYVGKAAPGSSQSAAVWQIQMITYSGGNVTSVLWAGSGTFTQVWNNRTSLSYS